MQTAPFRITLSAASPSIRGITSLVGPTLEWLLGFDRLNNCHARTRAMAARDDRPFCDLALDSINVTLHADDEAIERIPATGPLVVVANHPFGGLDGLALLSLVKRRRPDVKILANHLLAAIPDLAEDCHFVDPFGGAGAAKRNVASMRAAIRWVKSAGGALIVFPAGEVSSLTLRSREVTDIAWSPSIARLIRTTRATVVPVFFPGRNSDAFQIAGLLSARLRTLLLPRELLKKRGSRIRVHVGTAIAPEKLEAFDTDDQLAAYLRVRTYLLAGRSPNDGSNRRAPREEDPVAVPESVDAIEFEIRRLPEDQLLATNGAFHVYYARAKQIPTTLREIGRLRELTFRAVGEGTGRAVDLDRFDDSYLHLFVWDDARRQVVGAYRLGLTDEILATQGKDGLYTHTLFTFRDELLAQLGPAIELGRSFVRAEYQKEFAPLMLLWKGIGRFVASRPKYRVLFGPVSISNEYRSFTKQLLIEFLKINTSATDDLLNLVAPRNPPRFGPGRNWSARVAGTIVRTIDGIDDLIGEVESERGETAGMPVLLRQYLKLNAKLLGFNVDPDFGDVLDGLMMVDLATVAPAILTRYMGRENAAAFLAHHTQTV